MSWDLSSKWFVNYSICVFVGPDFQYCAHLSLVSVIDKHTQICPTCFNILQTTPSKYKEKKKNLVALWMFSKSWSTLYMPTRQLRTTHLLVFGEFSKENISLFFLPEGIGNISLTQRPFIPADLLITSQTVAQTHWPTPVGPFRRPRWTSLCIS